MSFVAILMALLLEQARPLARANPIHSLLRSWVRWAGRNFDAGRPQHGWLTWCVAALVPSACVASVYWLLAETVGWPGAVLWNIAVLYLTLGFRQFSHHFTVIRDALEAGDDEGARQLLAEWTRLQDKGLQRSDIVRQVIEHSVIAAHRHVFGVLAWFSVLAALGFGPAGAVLYRLSEFVARFWAYQEQELLQPVSKPLQDVGAFAWNMVDWLPARVTAVGFAVVGSFEEAIESWRSYEQRGQPGNDGVILAATAGAINLSLGPNSIVGAKAAARTDSIGGAAATSGDGMPMAGQQPEVGHLRTVVGLVWRTVVMWMILLALLTLARLLG